MEEDTVYEVMKHLDAISLARASCVSRKWYQISKHENLWESLCIQHWPSTSSSKIRRFNNRSNTNNSENASNPNSSQRIRSVVASLGGFREFFQVRLGPMLSKKAAARGWGRDEVHLSLSLFSIDCFVKDSLLKHKMSSSSTSLMRSLGAHQRDSSRDQQ